MRTESESESESGVTQGRTREDEAVVRKERAWMGVLREYRGVGVAEAMPGARLTELVCKGMRKLFTLHRKLLKNNQEYQGRTRDPPRVNLAGALDSEPETEPSVD